MRAWWKRERSDDDFREEIETHLALEAERLTAQRDLPPSEARDAARRAFGNVTSAQERFYDSRRAWIDRVGQHVRYAIRTLRQHPGFTIATIVTLAIGIGFNTAIFTLFYSLAYRPLPIRDADRLVNVYQVMRGTDGRSVYGVRSYVSYTEYRRYRDAMAALPSEDRSLVSAAAYRDVDLAFEQGQRKSTKGEYVSCNFFETVGVRLAFGRGFAAGECSASGAVPVAVISHDTWVRDLGSDPTVLGRRITLNRIPFTVVGVAEPGFHGMEVETARLWIPVTMQPAIDHGRDTVLQKDASWLIMVGRLAPGATANQVREQLTVQARLMDLEHRGRETRPVVVAAAFLNFPEVRSKSALAIGMILGLGGLVIAMVCANIMNLLLARGLARRREIGIRLAIGASRGRLVEQLLSESLILALAGGLLGFALAFALPVAFASLIPAGTPQLQIDFSPDHRVLLFSTVVSMVTALVFGLLPALQSTDVDLMSASRDGASTAAGHRVRPSRLRSAVVGVQVAGSALLLIVAALFTRAAARGSTIDPGYATKDIVSFELNLRQLDYRGDRAWSVYTQLAERLKTAAGVEEVALVSRMPLLGRHSEGVEPITPGAPRDPRRSVRTHSLTDVSGNFFSTMQIPLVAGRAFTDRELVIAGTQGVLPAVISEAMATVFWPALRPDEVVGKHIRAGQGEYVVTGVARNVRYLSFGDAASPFVYRGARAASATDLRLIARVRGSMATLERSFPAWAAQVDPAIVAESERFSARVDMELLGPRLTSTVAGAMGALALLLAVVGIYGVVSYSVGQRGREIAVRLALGATREGVVALMMRQSSRALVVGLAVGLLASIGVSLVVRGLLLGVSPLDPLTYMATLGVLGGAGVLAAYLPARRAAAIDPARALRED